MTTPEPLDVSSTILAKSDQLNASDLAQPIIVQLVDVRLVDDEKQPVHIRLSGDWKPWKPCKTTRRILVMLWGPDARQWIGRWVRLYSDPTVIYGGEAVGGIRISGASGFKTTRKGRLPYAKGKYAPYTVEPIQPPNAPSMPVPTAQLLDVLNGAGLTLTALDAWLVSVDKRPAGEGTDEARGKLAGWLAADPVRLGAVRAFMPEPEPEYADDGEE